VRQFRIETRQFVEKGPAGLGREGIVAQDRREEMAGILTNGFDGGRDASERRRDRFGFAADAEVDKGLGLNARTSMPDSAINSQSNRPNRPKPTIPTVPTAASMTDLISRRFPRMRPAYDTAPCRRVRPSRVLRL